MDIDDTQEHMHELLDQENCLTRGQSRSSQW